MKMFMELSPKQEQKFRKWSRENYQPYTEINGTWHPVVQDECVKMNKESASYYPFVPKA